MKKLNKVEEIFIGTLLFIGVCLITINVILRQFGMGLSWTEEIVRYFIIWITFIGSSICIYEGSHIAIDFIQHVIKGKAKLILNLVLDVICVIFSILLAYYSYFYLVDIGQKNQLSPATGVPIVYFYSVILISSVLMIIRYIQDIICLVQNRKENIETHFTTTETD